MSQFRKNIFGRFSQNKHVYCSEKFENFKKMLFFQKWTKLFNTSREILKKLKSFLGINIGNEKFEDNLFQKY
ncbi:hypothetical protein T4E_2323 [Trichinella pseudospiralis]|uniref:Uncharacterized protein n=1 Tax=Trichinella pseudospiralis TaxID=6337 RepID=A0A0V0WJW3_TRIPS|nr:hypothetical protein T4E_2323 [Trichinella pseudospiralis]